MIEYIPQIIAAIVVVAGMALWGGCIGMGVMYAGQTIADAIEKRKDCKGKCN